MQLDDGFEESFRSINRFISRLGWDEMDTFAEFVENYQNRIPIPFSRGYEWTCEIPADCVRR